MLRKSEDKLLEMEFEQILAFLQTDLFEGYRAEPAPDGDPDIASEKEWLANDFVRDAYEFRMWVDRCRGRLTLHRTPFMLDGYENEYEEQCREQNKHALELDQLRNANRNLSAQV